MKNVYPNPFVIVNALLLFLPSPSPFPFLQPGRKKGWEGTVQKRPKKRTTLEFRQLKREKGKRENFRKIESEKSSLAKKSDLGLISSVSSVDTTSPANQQRLQHHELLLHLHAALRAGPDAGAVGLLLHGLRVLFVPPPLPLVAGLRLQVLRGREGRRAAGAGETSRLGLFFSSGEALSGPASWAFQTDPLGSTAKCPLLILFKVGRLFHL